VLRPGRAVVGPGGQAPRRRASAGAVGGCRGACTPGVRAGSRPPAPLDRHPTRHSGPRCRAHQRDNAGGSARRGSGEQGSGALARACAAAGALAGRCSNPGKPACSRRRPQLRRARALRPPRGRAPRAGLRGDGRARTRRISSRSQAWR
jgi:hypothetical protein